MNFPSFDFDQHLEALHQWLAHTSPASPSSSPGQERPASTINPRRGGELSLHHDRLLHQPSPPRQTAPSLGASPVREARSSQGPRRRPQPSPTLSPLPSPWGRDAASDPLGNFDEAELTMAAAANAARMGVIKDELAVIAGKITPGVDDTPYIQYALDALTREPLAGPRNQHAPLGASDRRTRDHQTSLLSPGDEGALPVPKPAYDQTRHRRTDARHIDPIPAMSGPFASSEEPHSSSTHLKRPSQWIAVDKDALQAIDPRGRTYPPLTFKPRILRSFSMAAFVILCLLMMAAYIFSNRYSQQNAGLTPYPGSIYSGQYFVFRILPQLVAAVILIYAQSILATSIRIAPFTAMAKEDPRGRYLALFESLYAKSFLLPRLAGPWQLILFDLATWLAAFTVPLQSAAFTCIYVRDEWIWAASQGVAWTLVGLYAFLSASAAVLLSFWYGQWTGLRWDMRSIADLIPLLSRTNTMHSYYARRALLEPRSDLKAELQDHWFDRLGYWQAGDTTTGGIWHAIGTSAMPPEQGPELGADHIPRGSYDLSIGSRDAAHLSDRSCLYLPWRLRDGPLVGFVMTTGGLLTAMLIVSFLPQTRLDAGFVPMVAARPSQAAFSAANFLYSFVPALLGMVLFLLFQSMDQSLRMLQPWGDMAGPEGATARRSILADYAACLPVQSTWRALENGHWRAAVTSLMAVLFVVIPVLAGGLFMALTSPDGRVRMFPSMPVLGALLAFLFLYVGNLCLLVPRRRQFMLPHAVDSVAAIISLCSGDDVVRDAAFRAIRSHDDVVARLGAGGHDSREESVWFFGLSPGKDEQRLSVRRRRRFTELGGARTARTRGFLRDGEKPEVIHGHV